MRPVSFPTGRTVGITWPLACGSDASDAIPSRARTRARQDRFRGQGRNITTEKEMIMRRIKGSGGKTASETRKSTLHGSTAMRRMAKWGGQLQRLGEKPKGPKGPGKGK